MLVKSLGIVDLILGLCLIFQGNLSFPKFLLIVFGAILLAKSLLGFISELKDIASWIDLFAGIIFISSIVINVPFFIGFILGLFLIQKGIFSLL